METNLFLANFIRLLHILLVLFILIAPFTDTPGYLVLHIALSISLLTHWVGNSDICSLSLLESKLRGNAYNETFMHQIVSPVYKINDTTLSKISYIVVITLMIVSMYKLYKTKVFSLIKKDIENINGMSPEPSFGRKVDLYTQAISRLFDVRNSISTVTV
jgi:hypothetical protein